MSPVFDRALSKIDETIKMDIENNDMDITVANSNKEDEK
jgi:hypothetical protein